METNTEKSNNINNDQYKQLFNEAVKIVIVWTYIH
jgi:hypothetical protein